MVPGDEIAGRFVIDEVTNAGNFSTLFRAHDRTTGESVALKVMGGADGSDLVRFSREARLLAEQHHPGIVRYAAHGVTPQGAPWLAMEWLDGETLADRLDRGAMPFDDALVVASHVAAALAELHRLGVVHRDIKPANLFLPAGDVARIKVLDLGIARVPTLARRASTRIGTILGTPGFMAPEQVRGAAEIDARADVFALGCVLYECLTGRPAIEGDSIEALLGRTLLEDCPRVRATLPAVHPALDDLVARMVARDPVDRLADADAVVRALEPFARPYRSSQSPLSAAAEDAQAAVFEPKRTDPLIADPFAAETAPGVPSLMVTDFDGPTSPPTLPPAALGDAERRLLSVVLLARDNGAEGVTFGTLRVAAESYGAEFEVLWGTMAMIVLRSSGAATDQAARAARCALALRALASDAVIAVATGWGEESGHGAIGEVIDLASGMLHESMSDSAQDGRPIRLAEVAAGLLDARFEIAKAATGYALLGEREVVGTARPLLGRATPFVGRRRELATLTATLDECVEEPIARVTLVTGGAGTGKSRLRHEFERLASERYTNLQVWSTRGDPQHAGAPFVLLAPLVRRLAGIGASDGVQVRRQKLRARVARNVTPSEQQRVSEFLGELSGTTFSDASSAHLRLARLDASLMAAQMRRAWEDLVAAECRVSPLLLVLEDLQWGDVPSLRYVDAALRSSREAPLLVLALGRTETHDVFPLLWAERGVQEVRLGPLTRRAVESLARHCLGERADGSVLARIVERSGGNAFFLEELIVSVASGRGVALPGTVLAMVHARLGALGLGARRVLRAASIFGERFWRGGVASILGEETGGRTPEWLASLEERELVVPVAEGRFSGDQEYVFQSPQLRDAAYGTLTDADRALGHRLAASWLERAGETDATVLGEHLERGNAPARAALWYLDAARNALVANELGGVLARAERGVACGATGEALGGLLALQAEAHRWRGENAHAVRCGSDATRVLARDGAEWFLALRETAIGCGRLGDREALGALCAMVQGRAPGAEVRAAHASARAGAALACFDAGLVERGRALIESLTDADDLDGAETRGDLLRARAALALVEGSPGDHLAMLEEAALRFEESGNVREMCDLRVAVGRGRQILGMHQRSLGPLREARAAASRLGLHHVSAVAELHLAAAALMQGTLPEALAGCDRAIEASAAQGARRLMGRARALRCRILTAQGDHDRAVLDGDQAMRLLELVPTDLPWAVACLATAHLARRDVASGFSAAEYAVALLDSTGEACVEEAFVLLAHIDALTMVSRPDDARSLVSFAHGRMVARAEHITNPAWRDAWLNAVREHARLTNLVGQMRSAVESTLF
jgi:eukaryotic-like serine/threonine-protein kinase